MCFEDVTLKLTSCLATMVLCLSNKERGLCTFRKSFKKKLEAAVLCCLDNKEYFTPWMKIPSSHFAGTPQTQQSEDETETFNM